MFVFFCRINTHVSEAAGASVSEGRLASKVNLDENTKQHFCSITLNTFLKSSSINKTGVVCVCVCVTFSSCSMQLAWTMILQAAHFFLEADFLKETHKEEATMGHT